MLKATSVDNKITLFSPGKGTTDQDNNYKCLSFLFHTLSV